MDMPQVNFSSSPAIPLNAVEFRQQLGEILERVHYQYSQFQIIRKDKPMARLVNEEYMRAMERLIQENPALAETLEIMMDTKFVEALREDVSSEELVPLEDIVKD